MVQKAKKIVSLPAIADAEPEKSFWLCDGQTLKNLKELAQSLETMGKEAWGHHVTADKNDFANWVEDVFGQKQLGAALRKTKTARAAAARVKAKLETPKSKSKPKFWSFLM